MKKVRLKEAQDVLRKNNYPNWLLYKETRKIITKQKDDHKLEEEVPLSEKDDYTVLPYVREQSERLKRMLGKYGIKVTFRPYNQIQDHLTRKKDKTKISQRSSIVYRVPCDSCEKIYYGNTSQYFKTRLQQHRSAMIIGKPNVSGIADHANQCGHTINYNQASVVCQEEDTKKRETKEAFYISQHDDIINKQIEHKAFPTIYKLLNIRTRL